MRYSNLGIVLLAIWLIVTGLLTFIKIAIPGLGIIVAILALAAGILLLLERRRSRYPGMLLLSIFLIVTGLVSLVTLNFPGLATILALLAIAAGVLLFLEHRRASMRRNLGWVLLDIWLVLDGLAGLILSLAGLDLILSILAIAAGVLLLLRY